MGGNLYYLCLFINALQTAEMMLVEKIGLPSLA